MKYLDKSYRVESEYSQNEKKANLICSIIQSFVFVCASFAFFEALCIVCNMIGAIVCSAPYQALEELKRVLPILINLFGMIALNNSVHALTNARSEDVRSKKLMSRGITYIAIGGASLIYVIIGLIVGLYHGIVEGYPTPLFPLDLMVMSLVYMGIGASLIVYKTRFLTTCKIEIPLRKDARNPVLRVFDNIFYTIFEMIALFGFAAIIYSPFVVDWVHGHTFFNITLVLLFAAPSIDIAIWTFIFLPLKEGYKKEFQFRASIIVTVINAIILALYLITLQNDPSAPNDAAFGILPVEYTASVNASTYIYGLAIMIAPITSFIKSLNRKK